MWVRTRPRWRAPRASAVLVAAVLAGSVNASAQSVSEGVTVDCAALEDGAGASVVARLSGSLLSLNEVASLSLGCEGQLHTALLTVGPRAFKVQRVATPQDDSTDLLVELGLLAIDGAGSMEVKSETALDGVPSQSPADVFQPAREKQASTEVSPLLLQEQPRNRKRRSTSAMFVGLGAAYQHWGTELIGALGPDFAVGVRSNWFFLEASVVPYFGLGRSNGFTMMDLRWAFAIGVRPTSWMAVAVQPFLSSARASGPPETRALVQSSLRPGVAGIVEGAWLVGTWGLVVRGGLSFVGAARTVEQDGVQRLSSPQFHPLLGVGVRYAFEK